MIDGYYTFDDLVFIDSKCKLLLNGNQVTIFRTRIIDEDTYIYYLPLKITHNNYVSNNVFKDINQLNVFLIQIQYEYFLERLDSY